jgi:hypothetical protein
LLRILLLPLLWRWSWLLWWLWACNINTNETYECNKLIKILFCLFWGRYEAQMPSARKCVEFTRTNHVKWLTIKAKMHVQKITIV